MLPRYAAKREARATPLHSSARQNVLANLGIGKIYRPRLKQLPVLPNAIPELEHTQHERKHGPEECHYTYTRNLSDISVENLEDSGKISPLYRRLSAPLSSSSLRPTERPGTHPATNICSTPALVQQVATRMSESLVVFICRSEGPQSRGFSKSDGSLLCS